MKIFSQIPPLEKARSGFITNFPPYGHWRSQAPRSQLDREPLNIYIHIPYCIQRCAYCYYKTETLAKQRLAEIERYVSALCQEIELAAEVFGLGRYRTKTLYFGGGTPTLLSQASFELILEALSKHLTWDDIEFVVEGEPVTLTDRKARSLAALGVNRISLGIQSFADEIIHATGRKDTEEQALQAIERARETGALVNIDLLSGLAGETEKSWRYSLQRALETEAHCITIYKMELYPNTEYFTDVRQQAMSLPSEETELEWMRETIATLSEKGYEPLTFFTFGKEKDHAQKHIANRWRGEDMYGFGVSAFGQMDGCLIQNTTGLKPYIETLEGGALPWGRSYRLTAVDTILRALLLGMKLVHLDHREFRSTHGVDLTRVCKGELEDLSERGLVEVDAQRISLTLDGVLYGDYVGRVLAGRLWRLLEGEASS